MIYGRVPPSNKEDLDDWLDGRLTQSIIFFSLICGSLLFAFFYFLYKKCQACQHEEPYTTEVAVTDPINTKLVKESSDHDPAQHTLIQNDK